MIATAFPGLFNYATLLDLDARDFAWWTRVAQVENLRRRMLEMGGTRLAMYGDESYDRQLQNMMDQIELWEQPKRTDAEVLANWRARMKELKGAMKKMKR